MPGRAGVSKNRFEILVLDDSTDETVTQVNRKVAELQSRRSAGKPAAVPW